MGKIVADTLKQLKPDLVCCHNLAGWSVATWSAIKRAHVPFVQVLHDLYHLCPRGNMFRGNRPCLRQCFQCRILRLPHRHLSVNVTGVVGVSQYVLDRHLEYGYFRKTRIKRTIHNVGREISQHHPCQPSTDGKIRFGFIGSLVPSKGIELILTSFAAMNLPNAELQIAGTGKPAYQEHLQRYASPQITFLGYTQPDDFFPSIDILIVPSLWHDTLPSVVFEALSRGIPVIGSRRGGIPEMIRDGANGYLFEPEHPEELITLLRRVTMAPAEINAMRDQAKSSAAPFVDTTGWLKQYENLYSEVLAWQTHDR